MYHTYRGKLTESSRNYHFWGISLFFLTCCATTEAPKAPSPKVYTLRVEEPVPSPGQLPHYIAIYLDWSRDKTPLSSELGYKGWDFNYDGRVDMLEILDKDGKATSYAFDFDFDGKVDLIRKSVN